MGTTLRQFLQSLCCNSCWDYAVFWKLQQHQSQMLLTWEDGYCNIPKQRDSMESNICFEGSDDILSSNCESSMYEGNLGGYPIGLAVAYMSSVQYALGDGVVGEVAYTGNFRWVFSDNISAADYNSKLVSECQDEWLFQFVAGIKTVLLVPVLHGVLQLGSLEKVAEDPALVAYIKDKFITHGCFVGYSLPFTVSEEFLPQSSSSLMSTLMENLDESLALTMNEMKSEDSNAVDCVKPTGHKLPTTNQITPLCKAQNSSHISGKEVLKILSSATENDISVPLMGLIEVPERNYELLNCNSFDIMDSSMFRFSHLEEELQAIPYSNDYNMGVFGEYTDKTMNSYSNRGMMELPLVDKDDSNMDHKKEVSTFVSFPRHCELHKALGHAFMGQTNEYLWNSSVSDEDACSSSSRFCNGDLICGNGPSARETSGCFIKGYDAKHLLEAVVANVYCGSDDNSSKRTKSSESSTTSLGQNPTETSAVVGEVTVPRSCVMPAFGDRDRNVVSNSTAAASSSEKLTSELIEEQHEKGFGYPHPRKGSKQSSASKRRARPGDNQRPRPRDRQLIQDRVKELRELVPNGAKCSIDGLLDQTIKHMLFLRNVTDQADKLRQSVHQEVAGLKNLKSPETEGGRQNGTSWAFELGSEQQICPIIVEDLECPGHMLVEMLCNDHGRFIEIAEVILRLELTILKGVMKSRSDNTWARFIIEAPRGFHRMDIFWPLMQLLQHNRSPISSKI